MMNFDELLINRRSVRKFKDKKVANETILKIINDAILAPSSGNDQPWKFIIVNDKLIMKEISDEAKKNLLKRISLNPGDYAKKYEKMLNNESFNIFYNAPSMIFIIGEKKVKNMVINCTLAASYFMFSAAVHGLGTCWINFATVIDSPEILNKLGIPKECGIVAPIIIGYPEEIPNIPNRKEPEILKII